MTEEERLAKNERIREHGRHTRQKRTNQVCKVYRVKIDVSHLNADQRLRLKMLFVEAKRLYNDALTFIQTHDINGYDPATRRVHILDKDRKPVTYEIQYLSSQMRQSVIAGIKHSLKALASTKQHGRKTGGLKYKSDYSSIDLQQAGVTYRFYDTKHIGLQGFKKRLRVSGAEQFINEDGVELANAKLLNLPDGYYLAVTTFRDKGGKTSEYKPAIGIDMGIKTSITTSEGKKYTVLVEETERLKKLQRQVSRKKKGSSRKIPLTGRYKTRKLLKREYQKLDNRKQDAAAKIVHELLKHEKVYMQDENISGWQKGLFGRTVQHSILGLVKAKLIHHERVIVLPKTAPTTKYCPQCGRLKTDITLADRVYECSCGYREDRDVHAAKNMMLLSRENTCGTQADDTSMCRCSVQQEDVRQYSSQEEYCNLEEVPPACCATGSPRFHKRR